VSVGPAAAVSLLGLLVAGALLAAPAWGQAPIAPSTMATGGDEVTVIADRLEEIGADHLLIAVGNVEVTRGRQRLLADRVEFNRATGDAVAQGRVTLHDGEDRLSGERIDYNFRTGTGVVYEGSAHAAPYYRLDGERLERLGEGRYRVYRGLFTTCEDSPPTWAFRFGRADADVEELVWGTNASFWVKRVPLIPFFPVFAAAIRRERQTGFLFPRFGTSSRKGTFLELPFFWAISDSQDATVSADAYTERGYGLHLAYRSVFSREHRGEVEGFYVNESERPERDRHGFDAHRGWWTVADDWRLDRRSQFRADVNGVTDDFVLREYADRLHERSRQRVDSHLFLTRRWAGWNLVGDLFWYQDLTQRRPVELYRLPDLRLENVGQPLPGLPGAVYEVEASYVNFVRAVGADGQRLDVRPRATRPLPVLGLFTVSPFAGARLTGYDSTATGSRVTRRGGLTVQTTEDEPRLRALYDVGLDVESRVSRIWDLDDVLGIDAILHSIEPRINYTWLDGDDVMRYRRDGGTTATRLPQYDGLDAIVEAGRVSYSLTNRVRARTVAPAGTEPARWELMRFTIGHFWESLDPVQPLGPVTGDLIVNPNRIFSFRGQTSYNVQDHEGFQTGTTDLSVAVPPVTASLGTRFSKPDRVNFLQGTLGAQVLRGVALRGETNWDMRGKVFVENRIGLDLTWQCWTFAVEYVSRHDDEDELRFALNLLGVGAPITTTARLGALGLGAGDDQRSR
jgi:LPS-assembly protein